MIVIFLPTFFAQVIALLFLCFLMPALMDSSTRNYAYLLNGYYFSIWISEIVLIIVVQLFTYYHFRVSKIYQTSCLRACSRFYLCSSGIWRYYSWKWFFQLLKRKLAFVWYVWFAISIGLSISASWQMATNFATTIRIFQLFRFTQS